MADGQIVFEVTADGKRAIADIKDITNTIESESKKWDDAAEQSTDNIGNSFSGMLKKVVAGFSAVKIGQKLLEIGKDAINAASDLQEVQNVVDVTFGESSNEIDRWAKNAIKQYGLTETQAKRFASTMGAMMKSSGLAGTEIVGMSEELSGLAADMASFYNLDFDEAFQKIRSGISGETEPLKQLGINMSVANLNAFALQQGLSKTFEQMTQGEQVMLRYQYLMSATADAQGDFNRTQDGYANSLRLLQSNVESLTATLGGFLVGTAAQATSWINDFIGKLTSEPEQTLFDRVAEIDIDKDAKIKQIEAISDYANSLADKLGEISGEAGEIIGGIANGANKLESSSAETWEAVANALTSVDGLSNLFGEGQDAANTVKTLAEALSGESVTKSKAEAWKEFLGALSENADAVSKLTGQDADSTKEWLHSLAETAGELTPEDAAAWDTLLGAFLGGLALPNTDEGQQFIESLAQQFLAMGTGSQEAVNALEALYGSTDAVEEKQAAWLAICKELVRTIPGLSDIIDVNTGEVQGGIPAIKKYADEWERVQKYQAEIEALQKQQGIIEEIYDVDTLKGVMVGKRAIAEASLENNKSLVSFGERTGFDFMDFLDFAEGKIRNSAQYHTGLSVADFLEGVEKYKYNSMENYSQEVYAGMTDKERKYVQEYLQALYDYVEAATMLPVIEQKFEEGLENVAEEYGVTTEEIQENINAMNESEAAMTTLQKAANGDAQALEDVTKTLTNVSTAFADVADYAEKMRESVEKSVDSTVKGFEKLETYSQKNKTRLDEVSRLLKEQSKTQVGSEEWKQIQNQIDAANAAVASRDSMYAALESQQAWMEEYLNNLKTAQEMGLSNELLASLADGSEESAEYLAALVNGDATGKTAKEIDDLFKQVQDMKQQLTGELTDQQLSVDQVYENLVQKAQEAVQQLDMAELAKDNTAKTIEGLAQGIAENVPEVKQAVDAILAQLARLNAFGINFNIGGGGMTNGLHIPANGATYIASFDVGTDWIPYDNMLARLHEGEAVLTAEENKIWQGFKAGGLDYDQLGGVMRDNVKPGGNVYLDGRIVGRVVSDNQGKAYRQLQRSGWQG